jgi:hypothetical protein
MVIWAQRLLTVMYSPLSRGYAEKVTGRRRTCALNIDCLFTKQFTFPNPSVLLLLASSVRNNSFIDYFYN